MAPRVLLQAQGLVLEILRFGKLPRLGFSPRISAILGMRGFFLPFVKLDLLET